MTKQDLRIVFMGTPEFAVGTLQALVEGGYNVVAVVTQPDKPVGRHGSVLRPSEVKQYALQHDIPVLQPEKMKDPAFVDALKSFAADLQVVVAFRMLPEVVWAMPKYGTFNVHAALLPQYRGAAPINWAIINGETQTGVTTFFLDHDIDTGRIIKQKHFDIPDDADVEYVYDGLMKLGAEIALETIDALIAGEGRVDSMEQSALCNGAELRQAPKIFKETCQIDFSQNAKKVYDFIRGLSPIPGAWGEVVLPNGEKTELKIYSTRKTGISVNSVCSQQSQREMLPATQPGVIVKEKKHLYVTCGDELLEVLTLQPSGKKRMDGMSFANGLR